MKKKRPVDRKVLNPFQATEALKSFDNLYQRYLDTVYRKGVDAIMHSADASDTALKQFTEAFCDLTSRTMS